MPLPLVQPTSAGYRTVELDIETDREAMLDVDEWAFAFHSKPETLAELRFTPEQGRSVGVRHEATEELVALHSSFEAELEVPGGRVPAAGLTWVGVHPGHRRRGLATAMLTSHLQRTAARGEPVSALFAAEPEIYGRYGYGLAAQTLSGSLARGTTLRDVPGSEHLTCSLERLEASRHFPLVAELVAACARPGELHPRSDANLRNNLADPEQWRDGAEKARIAVVKDGEEPRAFCLFRRKEEWKPEGPAGTVRTWLWAARDAAALQVLWRTLTDLDLMASTRIGSVPLDSPLLAQIVNVRGPQWRVGDNVWVRVVDLAAALTARAYLAPFEVTLAVTDALLPANAGTWRVRGGGGGAEVTRLASEGTSADLALDVRELGAAYLGGTSLTQLVEAGLARVGEDAGAAERVRAASVAFGWHLAPVCTVGF